jgi:hypothetical protein
MIAMLCGGLLDAAPSKNEKPPKVITADQCRDTPSEDAYLGIADGGKYPPLCFFIHHADKTRLSIRSISIKEQ